MKIKSITIENFRGYKKFKEEFSSDSNIILIYGKNGYGKTSLFDSIEWCLTGDIKRIEEKDNNKKAFKNINSTSESKVQIIFEDGTTVERIINSNNETILKQPNSEKKVKEYLFRNEILEDDINDLFNFSYLLSQDLIGNFIRTINPKERYSILAKLLGLSNEYAILKTLDEEQKRLKDIKNEQEKEQINLKNNLNMYSNDLKLEMISDKMNSKFIHQDLNRLSIEEIDKTLKIEISELKNVEIETLKYNNIYLILKKNKEFKLREQEIINIKDKKESLESLYLNKEIEKLEEKQNTLIKIINNNLSIVNLFKYSQQDLDNKKDEYLNKKYTLLNVNKNFKNLREIFRENKLFLETLIEYENQVNKLGILKKTNDSLQKSRNLYEGLANNLYNAINDFIQNKNEINSCPLCNSSIKDTEEFKRLIEKNLNPDSNSELKIINDNYFNNMELINNTINEIEDSEKKLKEEIRKEILTLDEKIQIIEKTLEFKIQLKKFDFDIQSKLKNLELKTRNNSLKENSSLEEIDAERNYLDKELIKLESDEYNDYILYNKKYKTTEIENKLINLKASQKKIQNKINELEELKKYLLTNQNLKNKRNAEKAYKNLEKYLKEISNNIDEIVRFRKEANKIIGEETKTYLKSFEGSVKKLYNYLTPQKNFPDITLPLKQHPKAPSEANLEIIKDGKQYNPLSLLSSAQKNNLALSLFLGGNLSSNQLKIDTIFMDDPIQNMDDINIYSFIEIIRRLVKKSNKQIIISTHDERVAQYMLSVLKEEIKPIKLKTLGITE